MATAKTERARRAAVLRKVKDAIRNPHAWPGGYPVSVIMETGDALCPACARAHFRLIAEATVRGWRTGWLAAGAEIIWEGGNECTECNATLDAYPAK